MVSIQDGIWVFKVVTKALCCLKLPLNKPVSTEMLKLSLKQTYRIIPLDNFLNLFQLRVQSHHYIESNQLTCSANQLTSFLEKQLWTEMS